MAYTWFKNKRHCIEACRYENGFLYAIVNTVLNSCYCGKELHSSIPINHPYTCQENNRNFEVTLNTICDIGLDYFCKVYEVEAIDESPGCDHLYFKKQVHLWSNYKVDGGQQISCQYSRPSTRINNYWDQDTEKLARNSLMFADQTSRSNPAQGIQVKYKPTGTYQPFWTTSDHTLRLPWTLQSGFRTGNTNEYVFIKFGTPDRSAMIWGMQFMKEQIRYLGGSITVHLSYNYYKDVARGIYAASDLRSPLDLTNTEYTFTVSTTDLDDNGLYFFTDSGSQKPNKFVASTVFVKLNAGYINFDFIGTFYSFNSAWDGKHFDNLNDNWNEPVIANYWMSSMLYSFENNISHYLYFQQLVKPL